MLRAAPAAAILLAKPCSSSCAEEQSHSRVRGRGLEWWRSRLSAIFTIRSLSRTWISRHWRELRWPTLAKESTMRKFTVSFRMRILLQCLDGADVCDEP